MSAIIKVYLPNELVKHILSYHPFFFKYTRKYIKTTSVSEMYHRDDIISNRHYRYLLDRYKSCSTTIYTSNSTLFHNIFLFFETSHTESEEDSQWILDKNT